MFCVRQRPAEKPRTDFTDTGATLLGWPSRGGVIILREATAVDFTFLNISPLSPVLYRDRDMVAEDAFCKQLLLLGATWWDSEARSFFVGALMDSVPSAISDAEEDLKPSPTLRERRWVRVGWPSEPKGGLWVAEFDSNWDIIQEEDNLVPEDVGRVLLARDMDERCKAIELIGGRFYEDLQQYEGEACLKAWDWKTEGEVGPLLKTRSTRAS